MKSEGHFGNLKTVFKMGEIGTSWYHNGNDSMEKEIQMTQEEDGTGWNKILQ